MKYSPCEVEERGFTIMTGENKERMKRKKLCFSTWTADEEEIQGVVE